MFEDVLNALSLYGHDVVLWTLVAASVLTVTVGVERALHLAQGRSSTPLVRSLTQAHVPLDAPALAQLEDADGFEGRVLAAGLRAGRVGGLKTAEEALAGALSEERARLDRGMVIIGTVGSNAPFVGLLGTVFGIVRAFADLSLDTAAGSAAVMAGISKALIATGAGLLVAIPAVILYNALTVRHARFMGELERLSRIVLMQLSVETQASSRRT